MSLAKRIIPCLDVNAGRVVKGVNFVGLRDAGDPVEIARRYDEQGADELTFLDITASSDERGLILDIIEAVAAQVFIPLTVGGGVRTVEDVRRSSTPAPTKSASIPGGPESAARERRVAALRAQCSSSRWTLTRPDRIRCVGKFHARWTPSDRSRRGRVGPAHAITRRRRDPVTSMDRDGTRAGFDIEITRAFSIRSTSVIASGGVGTLEHLSDGVLRGHADAVLAASIFITASSRAGSEGE